jgi:signal transduction histidine kinase
MSGRSQDEVTGPWRTLRWHAGLGGWRTRDVATRDAVLAALLAACAFAPGLVDNGVLLGELPQRPMDAAGVALAMGQCLPLTARRRLPAVSLTAVVGCFSAVQLLGYVPTFASESIVVALYSVGAHQDRRRRTLAVAATGAYALLSIALHLRGSPERIADYLSFYLVLAACWGAGTWVRSRRVGEAERRHRGMELAVAEERARIAQDLHDVVTHHVTAMLVQADAAQFLLEGSPDRAAEGLTAISGTGRQALEELRRLLDVLDDPDGTSGAERTSSLGHVGALVDRIRKAGQPVELLEEGERAPMPRDAELAAYRVVQEALTNAVKHAHGHRTTVRVRYEDKEVGVEVTNDGPSGGRGHAAGLGFGGGRGLAGLSERVSASGGEFSAGARPEGGFVVRARLLLAGGA